jgi:hypothetical protein
MRRIGIKEILCQQQAVESGPHPAVSSAPIEQPGWHNR